MSIIVAVLLLGLIVIIHELGHFLLAKKNGVTVTEFSIGMGPRIASFVKNGTRYSLKVFPFGGSCMMLGEDETIEDEGAFNKKGVWARFSIIFAGAFFNFILAFVLALVVVGATGIEYPDITKVENNSPAAAAGLQSGDRIVKINGKKINLNKEFDFYFFFHPITGEPINITYLRNGKQNTVAVTPKAITSYLLGINYDQQAPTAQITQIDTTFPLGQAGVQAGDVIVGVDGNKIDTALKLHEYFKKNPLSDKPVSITYERNGAVSTVNVVPKFVKDYDIGIQNGIYKKSSALSVIKYSFYELKFNIMYALDSIGYLISGKASVKEISGPVGIVNVVGQVVSETKSEGIGIVLLNLASFTILISANLGVMNLLPIPALDGGRLVFLIIEAVRRKPVPKEKEAMVHLVGMALLMVLMVFVLFNDIRNIFS